MADGIKEFKMFLVKTYKIRCFCVVRNKEVLQIGDKCEECDGTGKCSRCDGTGEDKHGLFGLGLINDYCKKCSGSGECRFCDGTGEVSEDR